MKNILVKWIVISATIGIGIYVIASQPATVDYENMGEEVIEEVKETPAWMSDADAIKAAEAVVKRKELEAKEATLKEEIKARQVELTAIQKELGSYWRDEGNIKALIRATFPEDASTAIAIVKCESGFNHLAYNPSNNNGSTDGGLWQVNSVHDKTLERMGLDKYNPEDATKFARYLYDESGWRPWVCSRKI